MSGGFNGESIIANGVFIAGRPTFLAWSGAWMFLSSL
jgi:hypothetical protein